MCSGAKNCQKLEILRVGENTYAMACVDSALIHRSQDNSKAGDERLYANVEQERLFLANVLVFVLLR